MKLIDTKFETTQKWNEASETPNPGNGGVESESVLLDFYSRSVIAAVEKVGPAVVHIRVQNAAKRDSPQTAGSGSEIGRASPI